MRGEGGCSTISGTCSDQGILNCRVPVEGRGDGR